MQITNYWVRTLEQQRHVQSSTHTVAGHGGPVWCVRGVIEIAWTHWEEHDDCKDELGLVLLSVDEIVCAPRDKAADIAANRVCGADRLYSDGEWKWIEGHSLSCVLL